MIGVRNFGFPNCLIEDLGCCQWTLFCVSHLSKCNTGLGNWPSFDIYINAILEPVLSRSVPKEFQFQRNSPLRKTWQKLPRSLSLLWWPRTFQPCLWVQTQRAKINKVWNAFTCKQVPLFYLYAAWYSDLFAALFDNFWRQINDFCLTMHWLSYLRGTMKAKDPFWSFESKPNHLGMICSSCHCHVLSLTFCAEHLHLLSPNAAARESRWMLPALLSKKEDTTVAVTVSHLRTQWWDLSVGALYEQMGRLGCPHAGSHCATLFNVGVRMMDTPATLSHKNCVAFQQKPFLLARQ